MKNSNESGLTIVELLISISIAAALATVLLAVSLGFFGSTIRSQITAEMAVDSHFMMRAVVEDLRLGESIDDTNDLSHAETPAGSFTTSDANNVLIINRPATTADNDIIYDTSTGAPYENEYVYFVSNRTLYKRLLKNTAAPNNAINTTCPESSASSTCPSDRKYSKYVDDMTLVFYDNNNNVTTDVLQARSVKIGLSMSRRAFGDTITFDNSILTKLRN